jgi:hypothetical protein
MVRERPPELLRARLLAAAASEPGTRPGAWRRRLIGVGLLAAVWMVVMTAMLGPRHDWNQLPMDRVIQGLSALIGGATVASAVGMARGRAMVGAASETLLGVVFSVPLALLIAVSVIDPRGPSTLVFSGVAATLTHSIACDLLVLMVALPLIGLGWGLTRGLTLARPALSGACLGLGAATWAHAVVRIHCPIGGPAHAIIAHILPSIPLMLLAGWALGRAGHRSAAPHAPVRPKA